MCVLPYHVNDTHTKKKKESKHHINTRTIYYPTTSRPIFRTLSPTNANTRKVQQEKIVLPRKAEKTRPQKEQPRHSGKKQEFSVTQQNPQKIQNTAWGETLVHGRFQEYYSGNPTNKQDLLPKATPKNTCRGIVNKQNPCTVPLTMTRVRDSHHASDILDKTP